MATDKSPGIEFISNPIVKFINNELSRIGLYYRIFSRIKTYQSIKEKREIKQYSQNGKRMQDLIGIRITSYFPDDIKIIIALLKDRYNYNSQEIDELSEDTFKPQRVNIVFDLDNNSKKLLEEDLFKTFDFIDPTFEIQLRTVLSEGWHEVEHDLRYKSKNVWGNHMDLSRALNGIYATLETSEWSMINLFELLSYRCYKEQDLISMIRNKFRIKLSQPELLSDLNHLIMKNHLKDILKLNRIDILKKIAISKLNIPLSYNNFLFLLNHLYLKNADIKSIQDDFITHEFELYLD